jgi:hypothetical protein
LLRELTARQFVDWVLYDLEEPFGEAHHDRRVALLAAVIAGSAGATTSDGKPYTAATFLAALHGDPAPPAPPPPRQTGAEIEARIMNWVTTANDATRRRGAR